MKHDWIICDNLYSQQQCSKIIDLFVDNINSDIHDSPADNVEKTSDVIYTNYRHLREELKAAHEFVKYINKSYFAYDLFDVADGDVLSMNTYCGDKKSGYGWHTDSPKTLEVYDYKLTVLLNLSQEDFAGGIFQIFTNGGEQFLREFGKPGSICVIPSWIPHRVSNVTLGKRITLTQFYSGPKFR
jgi:hypothetical protein